MAVVTVNKSNFEEEIVKSSGLILLDFWAPWCGPCRMLSPVIEEIANENTSFKVCKVNIDEEEALADTFRISVIPTLILFKDGNRIWTGTGVRSKADLLEVIKANE